MKKPTKQPKQAPIIAKGNEKSVVEKLIRHAETYDAAWRFIHQTFPRAKFGLVRAVVQKFSAYKTLRAAFNALHGKNSAKRAGNGRAKIAA